MEIETRDTPFGSERLEGFVRVRLLSYAKSILSKKLTVCSLSIESREQIT